MTPPTPLLFACMGETLTAMLHLPEQASRIGVIIVPGGTQFRVGAHRGFVDLATTLTANGYAVLRFDVRGMGDASGCHPGFEALGPDITSAIKCLRTEVPTVESIILLGLCDGASAILLAASEITDIQGAILLNPWVRSQQSAATTTLTHHYRGRLTDAGAWRRLLTGKTSVLHATASVGRALWRAMGPKSTLQTWLIRLADNWRALRLPLLVVIGQRDFTGAEFLSWLEGQPDRTSPTQIITIAGGDHSFSTDSARTALANTCAKWISASFQSCP